MVQLVNSGNLRPESDSPCLSRVPVKLEVEDPLDEEHGAPNKRSKISHPRNQKSNAGTDSIPPEPASHNPQDESSPLGLRLRKSPSLLELIQMRLSQSNTAAIENLGTGKKDLKSSDVLATTDKLKASNFPASFLRIGTWECVSRYEGDLVAKCYFAKHKLVWEVLDGGLKSKIEIQWSDITALKATYTDNGPATLDIVLARQPLFFRETNPQPRKHTLWQATSDFTGGQASINRRHFLQCPPCSLTKHFEKLIQCDHRLNLLSQQPEIVLDNPYFECRSSVFEGLNESKDPVFNCLRSDCVSTSSGISDTTASCAAQSSFSSEIHDTAYRATEVMSSGIPSSSVMDKQAIGVIISSEKEELKEKSQQPQSLGRSLCQSMSASDLVSQIGHCISEQMTSGEGSWSQEIMDELTTHLLSDSQFSSVSDEKFLMSRVNSLCSLLQKDVATAQVKREDEPD